MQKKILLVGESWTSTSTHVKGFDQFTTAYRQTAMLEGRRYNFGGRIEF